MSKTPVRVKMSIIIQTKTRQTKIWNASIFFFPIAVPVHGHLKNNEVMKKGL